MAISASDRWGIVADSLCLTQQFVLLQHVFRNALGIDFKLAFSQRLLDGVDLVHIHIGHGADLGLQAMEVLRLGTEDYLVLVTGFRFGGKVSRFAVGVCAANTAGSAAIGSGAAGVDVVVCVDD